MAALARRNAELNGVAERMQIVDGDLRRVRALQLDAGAFDLVVSNPPFREAGRGREAKGAARAVARQELSCTLADVISAARRFARPRGRVALVFPAERTAELFGELTGAGLPPRRVRAVHSVADEPARRVLVEGVRNYRGGTTLLPPLVVHRADRRTYTEEAERILSG
jgi:tRNA1(Val) A37 N6-methylase TrmN6